MLIRVIYQDFKYDFIKPHRLDEFIKAGKVAMFRRSSGWAIVGIDPIREKQASQNRERRQSWEEPPH